MSETAFDVIVVGGAMPAARRGGGCPMGARTALVTHRFATIGEMFLQPGHRGLGKGHLVREIDGAGRPDGRVADAAGIQFRLLNRSKGPAVQVPVPRPTAGFTAARCRPRFGDAQSGGDRGAVEDLIVEHGNGGRDRHDGRIIRAGSVVLTTGTFLRA